MRLRLPVDFTARSECNNRASLTTGTPNYRTTRLEWGSLDFLACSYSELLRRFPDDPQYSIRTRGEDVEKSVAIYVSRNRVSAGGDGPELGSILRIQSMQLSISGAKHDVLD